MIRGLYTAVTGLVTLEAKQDVITNNIANANTTGFKGDNLSIKSFEDVLLANKEKLANGNVVKNTLGKLNLGAKIDETNTLWTQGTLNETEKKTDFGIQGSGFFTVRKNTAEGVKEYYTRDGNFRVNTQGYLVTNTGDSVLGVNNATGAREPIYIGNNEPQLDANGNLFINGVSTYKFATADFEDYNSLKKVGDNLYEGQNPNYGGEVSVQQGVLEKSNVNIINEMVNMMTVMRSFETNQKVVQTLDETLGKAASEIGAVR